MALMSIGKKPGICRDVVQHSFSGSRVSSSDLAPPVLESTTLSAESSTPSETEVDRAVSPLGMLHNTAVAPDSAPSKPSEKTEDAQTQRRMFSLSSSLQRLACFAAGSPILCCSLVCILLVGLPVSFEAHNDAALDTFVLVFLWTGTLAAQAAVRSSSFSWWNITASPNHRARARSVLATLLNAVLWTSLSTIAYLAIKAAARHRSIDDALATFSTGTKLVDLIAHTPSSSSSSSSSSLPTGSQTIGAGDLASAVLDAGIVSWGLKLFECRAQLLSRAGLTTLIASAVFAVGNIVCGPLLVHSMGLASPAKQLAFAARSVTLALAGPAMTNLGGDVGLNAAMVVFNGIVFQVAMGLGVCRWVSRLLASAALNKEDQQQQQQQKQTKTSENSFRYRMGSGCWRSRRSESASSSSPATDITNTGPESDVDEPPRPVPESDRSPSAASSAFSSSSASSSDTITTTPFKDPFRDVEKTAGWAQSQLATAPSAAASSSSSPYAIRGDSCFVNMRGGGAVSAADSDTPGTVATGMTVGINAAAMGTAYLYEDGSRTAPYAALSMTVFGVMTVVFTSIQPLAGWVVSQVQ